MGFIQISIILNKVIHGSQFRRQGPCAIRDLRNVSQTQISRDLVCQSHPFQFSILHYGDVTNAMTSQITSVSIVYSTVCSDTDQRKRQSSALLAFVRGIHRWPVNSPHKWPVTRKMFSFDDVIMLRYISDGYPILYSHPESYLVLSWQTSLKLIIMYHIAHNTTWNKICHVMRNLMKYILLHSISQKCQVKPHVNLEM